MITSDTKKTLFIIIIMPLNYELIQKFTASEPELFEYRLTIQIQSVDTDDNKVPSELTDTITSIHRGSSSDSSCVRILQIQCYPKYPM